MKINNFKNYVDWKNIKKKFALVAISVAIGSMVTGCTQNINNQQTSNNNISIYQSLSEEQLDTDTTTVEDRAAYYDKYDAETGTANYALKTAHGLMCTVTYTDGVENEEIFADKVCVVEQGSAAPAFDGNPTRSGYTFMGWTPAVTETVTADVTYTAQWKRIYRPTPSTPTV